MQIALEADDFGRLVCSIAHGETRATVTASDLGGAAFDLRATLDDLLRDGLGECYWREGGGEYRWLFRRDSSNARVAVLWSNGTLTGWEHVFWAEVPLDGFAEELRGALDRLSTIH
jgi:hypothetical protein